LTRVEWDAVGARFYEAGVDRGVLYISGQPGVPWNGLTSVTENASGGDAQPFYVDGDKFLNLSAPEEFQATLTAFTYPDEFGPCDGSVAVRPGLFATRQRRQPFGLTYRTRVANDVSGTFAYKIHLIYNALAAPSNRTHKSLTDSSTPDDFSWKLTALPPIMAGYRRTSHLILDSRYLDATTLAYIEDILYGDDDDAPRLPALSELTDLIDNGATLSLTDNGDGSYSMTAPLDILSMADPNIFLLTWDGITLSEDGTTYTITTP